MNYQFFDWEAFDYSLYRMDGVGYLRGPDPRPLVPGRYLSTIGSAHVFGRFVDRPFPAQLVEALKLQVVDLSTSAVAPSYFGEHERILQVINAGAACIVQMVSARSCENSEWTNRITRKNVFQRVADGPDAPLCHEVEVYPPLWASDQAHAIRLIDESKAT